MLGERSGPAPIGCYKDTYTVVAGIPLKQILLVRHVKVFHQHTAIPHGSCCEVIFDEAAVLLVWHIGMHEKEHVSLLIFAGISAPANTHDMKLWPRCLRLCMSQPQHLNFNSGEHAHITDCSIYGLDALGGRIYVQWLLTALDNLSHQHSLVEMLCIVKR